MTLRANAGNSSNKSQNQRFSNGKALDPKENERDSYIHVAT